MADWAVDQGKWGENFSHWPDCSIKIKKEKLPFLNKQKAIWTLFSDTYGHLCNRTFSLPNFGHFLRSHILSALLSIISYNAADFLIVYSSVFQKESVELPILMDEG